MQIVHNCIHNTTETQLPKQTLCMGCEDDNQQPKQTLCVAQADPLCDTNAALLDVTSAANKQTYAADFESCNHNRVEYTVPARKAAPACKSGSGCSCLVSAGFGGRAWRQLALAGMAYCVALLACDCSTALLVCVKPMLSPTSPAKWQACFALIGKACRTDLIKHSHLSDEGVGCPRQGDDCRWWCSLVPNDQVYSQNAAAAYSSMFT